MKHGIPYVIGFVLPFAFVLLLVAFRSIVVPLKAIALNLLSVGAAYGVLALVFQHRWAQRLLGFTSNGAIISWLPRFLFVVLFGLSMDYHVFILSRVREAVDGGMRTDDAVRYGITVTAGVVTSAALVMVGRVRALRHALVARAQPGRRRPRRRGADRRNDRPRGAPPGVDALLGDRNRYLPPVARSGTSVRGPLEAPPRPRGIPSERTPLEQRLAGLRAAPSAPRDARPPGPGDARGRLRRPSSRSW